MKISTSIPLGLKLLKGQLIGVMEADNGINCECVCPLCRTPLVANQGPERQFFSHVDKSKCYGNGAKAGVLLLLEQHLTSSGVVCFPSQVSIYKSRSIMLKEARTLSFIKVESIGNREISDSFLCTTSSGEKVIVTGDNSEDISIDYKEEGIPVLVVEIAKFEKWKSGDIRKHFIECISSPEGHSWLYFPGGDKAKEEVKREGRRHRVQEDLFKQQRKRSEPLSEIFPPKRGIGSSKRSLGTSEVVSGFDSGNSNAIDFSTELNEEQYAAVTAPDGPALVVAAAGTGKTRTLIYRLAYLVTEKKVQPWEVLLLTFTNKAAKEMLTRAELLVQRKFNSGYSGTFHSFANRLLRSHADSIGFGRDFTILDADDAKKLMRSCADELEMDKKHFPKPDVLLSLFGVVSGRMGDLSAAVDERFEHSEVSPDDVLKVHARYQARKKDANSMDFDDLLIFALQVLADHKKIRTFYQEEFKYVLVDEYQDTNSIQAELVNLLVKAHGNLMVVGDDFQSIYSWRGADFRNFLDFETFYPGAETFKLQVNYRSTPEILEVANEVIAGNPEQFQKELQPVRESMAKPHFAKVRDGSVQARYVIERARELNRSGLPLSEICVLYRSHFHAMELQMELARAQMPYVVTSGVRFFEQAHIKDVCTILKLMVNPSDELAFTRLLEMFPKVGKKTSLKIFRKLGGRANLQRPETHEELIASLPKAAREGWEQLKPLFLSYREDNLQNDPGEVIFRFNKAFYKEYMVENFDNHKFRAEDIDGLIDFTVKFESTESFLSEIALLSNLDNDGSKAPREEEQDGLRLSTIHQAKGLEWKAVFVLFLNEDMFPSKKAIEEAGDSEERRLFYVAVTRAEDQLFLCSPMVRRQRDGGIIFLDPSRFLAEIPEDLLQPDGGFF